MDMVRDLGVDFAQGYHLGKPAPVSCAAPALQRLIRSSGIRKDS